MSETGFDGASALRDALIRGGPSSPPYYSASEACIIAGITRRQLGYWLDRGVLLDAEERRWAQPGRPLRFDWLTIETIMVLARVIRPGISPAVAQVAIMDEVSIADARLTHAEERAASAAVWGG